MKETVTDTLVLLPRESIAWILYRQDNDYRPLRVRVITLDNHAQWLMPDGIPSWLRMYYGPDQNNFMHDIRSWPIIQKIDEPWEGRTIRMFDTEQAAWDDLLKQAQSNVDEAQLVLAARRTELNNVAARIQQIRNGG